MALDQVLRALAQQQGSLDNLRARAATLVAAASLVSSFFGATALSDNAEPPSAVWVVLAFSALFVVIVAAVLIVWPYTWLWGIDGHRLLADYVEDEPPATLDEMRRSLVYYIQKDINSNTKKLNWLWRALRVAIIGIGAEVLFWMLGIGL